jgi:uncharacterized integral membrane protein
MIKRIVGWFILVPLCVALIVFALANRQVVLVQFDPVSPENPLVAGIHVPLFIVIYFMLICGILLGGIAVWFAQGRYRRDRRAFRRQAAKLDGELAIARKANRRRTEDNALLSPDDLLDDL